MPLGQAYGLGRALAETILLPDGKNPLTFQQVFARYRLANLLGWLADLKSAFPPHAAEAVRGSLQAWTAWSEAPTLHLALDEQRPASDAEADSQPRGTAAIRAPTASRGRLQVAVGQAASSVESSTGRLGLSSRS